MCTISSCPDGPESVVVGSIGTSRMLLGAVATSPAGRSRSSAPQQQQQFRLRRGSSRRLAVIEEVEFTIPADETTSDDGETVTGSMQAAAVFSSIANRVRGREVKGGK